MKVLAVIFAISVLQIPNSSLWAQSASVICPGNLKVSTDPGNCSAVVNNIDPVVSPSNAKVSYTITSSVTSELGIGSVSGKTFLIGVNTVTYYLPDYPGVSCSFIITVEDKEPPVITCPPPVTVNCTKDVPLPASASATDNCTPSHLINVQFVSDVTGNATCPHRYTITRTYKATDLAGNTSTCSQTITVYDSIAPHFLQPPPISPLNVSCSSEVPPANSDYYTAYDECDEWDEIIPVYKQVKTNGSCPNQYTLTRTWTATDICGNKAVYTQVINVDDQKAPEFVESSPSPTILVSCASGIPTPPKQTAKDCNGDTATVRFTEVRSDEQCVNKFKLTRTWTATDSCGNTATRTQVIVVNDQQPPVFDGLPPSLLNVSCAKDIPAAPVQTVTDNCGGKPVITYTEAKSNVQCANRFILTRTWVAKDECGNSSTRTQVINVYDNQPPKLSGISANKVVLWPPNHKMQDVVINYTATDNCEVFSALSVSSSDPVNGGSDGDQSPDWEVIDAHHVRLRAEKANNGQARVYAIRITVTDSCNGSVDSTINVVVAHNITAPPTGNPYKVGSVVSFNGVFRDKPGNVHTAKWLLDGSTVASGSVNEPSGNQDGKVSGSYKFNTPGVYKLQMNVTDQNGLTSWVNTNNDLDAIVVIYDPNGGNAYGGGWYQSPAGALSSNPSLTGKASYGFAVNYANAAKPKGETQFEFKLGSFEFNALNFDYLSISGAKAQFRGTGKIIGGQSGIGFIMTIIDGALDGSAMDKIRMKIYNRNTGQVYYDNQPGASDADDPSEVVEANSSVVIQGPQVVSSITVNNVEAQEKSLEKLEFVIYPNPIPSGQHFSVQIKTNDLSTKLQLRVFDQQGRLVEKRENIEAGALIKLGGNYRPGIYYLSVIQGSLHGKTKLVKVEE